MKNLYRHVGRFMLIDGNLFVNVGVCMNDYKHNARRNNTNTNTTITTTTTNNNNNNNNNNIFPYLG